MTRSATSSAKLHLVRHDQHGHAVARQVRASPSSTSPTSSGSSAEVASSNSISLRLHGERAGDGDALLLAAGEPLGIVGCLVRQAHLARAARRACGPRLGGGRRFSTCDRAERHVLQRGQMREQVEPLEHHADAGADPGDLPVATSRTNWSVDQPFARSSLPFEQHVSRTGPLDDSVMQRNIVVLPEPLGPMIATFSPARTSRDRRP